MAPSKRARLPPLRAVWATDVHLNFLTPPARRAFAASVRLQEPDVVLLSGDIAEACDLAPILASFAAQVENLVVHTGSAAYGAPRAQDVLLDD